MGPIEEKFFCGEGKVYVLTIIDRFSRWIVLKIMNNIESKTIVKEVENYWLKKYLTPKNIITDWGRQFTSKHFRILCNKYNIKHKFTSAYNPTGKGIFERINRSIVEGLRLYRGEK